MILAIYLIVNLIAAFIANKIRVRIGDTCEAEDNMLQMLLRFALTVLVFGGFLHRVETMALAVIGPLLYLMINFIIHRFNDKVLFGSTVSGGKLISDIIQVITLTIVCQNLQYLI